MSPIPCCLRQEDLAPSSSRAFPNGCVFDENAQRISMDGRPKLSELCAFPNENRDLKIRRQSRRRDTSKSNRFRLAKQQLCTCITLFCTIVCHYCTTTTWKCIISRFMEYVNKQRRNLLPLSEQLDKALRDSIPGEFLYIWKSKWYGIIAMKTEKTRIHCKSDPFAAVAFLES